jgi:hypothetical protein
MNLCQRPRCSYFDEDNMAVVGKGVAVLQGGRVALGGQSMLWQSTGSRRPVGSMGPTWPL